MPPDAPPPTPGSPVQKKLAADIERVGWAAIGVMPTKDDPIDPFTYTIGLWRGFDHPELIITGMRHETAHALLTDFVERIEKGESFEASRDYPETIRGRNTMYTASFRQLSQGHRSENMRAAAWWNGQEDFPALQLVWPDPTGKFPWDEGYDKQFIQPVLTLDPD